MAGPSCRRRRAASSSTSRTSPIAVDADGITADRPRSTAAGTLARRPTVVELAAGQFLLPGLVDLHVHAPQWPQLGTCLDLPLERWLFEHTFPLEARYADPAFAAAVWPDLVRTLLRHGTTTAVYFAANDEASTVALAAECLAQGQRAFVGRVAMDHPAGTPAWYRDALGDRPASRPSARSIEAIRALDAGRGLVRPIVTPRFAPACTDALLAGLGELAAATGARGADALLGVGLGARLRARALRRHRHRGARHASACSRPGTILAHANHVTDDDADADRGAARASPTARCRTPTSPTPCCRCGACSIAACASASAPTSPVAPRRACSPSASTR